VRISYRIIINGSISVYSIEKAAIVKLKREDIRKGIELFSRNLMYKKKDNSINSAQMRYPTPVIHATFSV
jgi:hypothetical protein